MSSWYSKWYFFVTYPSCTFKYVKIVFKYVCPFCGLLFYCIAWRPRVVAIATLTHTRVVVPHRVPFSFPLHRDTSLARSTAASSHFAKKIKGGREKSIRGREIVQVAPFLPSSVGASALWICERAIIKYLLAACHAASEPLRTSANTCREEKRSNLYLAARAAPFLGIHNKAASPPPGLKNGARPRRRPALTACGL
jgi:hypothetical protein